MFSPVFPVPLIPPQPARPGPAVPLPRDPPGADLVIDRAPARRPRRLRHPARRRDRGPGRDVRRPRRGRGRHRDGAPAGLARWRPGWPAGRPTVLVDLRRVSFVDCTGIGLLTQARLPRAPGGHPDADPRRARRRPDGRAARPHRRARPARARLITCRRAALAAQDLGRADPKISRPRPPSAPRRCPSSCSSLRRSPSGWSAAAARATVESRAAQVADRPRRPARRSPAHGVARRARRRSPPAPRRVGAVDALLPAADLDERAGIPRAAEPVVLQGADGELVEVVLGRGRAVRARARPGLVTCHCSPPDAAGRRRRQQSVQTAAPPWAPGVRGADHRVGGAHGASGDRGQPRPVTASPPTAAAPTPPRPAPAAAPRAARTRPGTGRAVGQPPAAAPPRPAAPAAPRPRHRARRPAPAPWTSACSPVIRAGSTSAKATLL